MLGEENYTLDIRPTFIDELDAAVRYIERTFRNYQAADDLVAKVYAAIDERLFAPESFEPNHVVVTVPPGGRTYTVAHLAPDDSFAVRRIRTFKSAGA